MRRATGTPTYVPTILADKVCALTIVYSVLAAVVHQRATGEGQHVEVPMTDTMLAFNLVEHLAGRTFEPPAGQVGFPRSLSRGPPGDADRGRLGVHHPLHPAQHPRLLHRGGPAGIRRGRPVQRRPPPSPSTTRTCTS